MNPAGKAVIKAAEYLPPHEAPSEEFPLYLITGRTLFHFHTRTKTGRAPQLQAAAPQVWVGMSVKDADERGISEGDVVEVSSARGTIGRRPEPGLLLLADLRHLHRVAAGISLDWELLAQAAKDAELLALAKRCHPESLRHMRWANAMLKVLSPQVLVS